MFTWENEKCTLVNSAHILHSGQTRVLPLSCMLCLFQEKLNFRDDNGYTAVMWATDKQELGPIRVLCEEKADMNIGSNYGITRECQHRMRIARTRCAGEDENIQKAQDNDTLSREPNIFSNAFSNSSRYEKQKMRLCMND